MTQAEMFTKAIDFQNKFSAINVAFSDGTWTEDAKIAKVFDQYPGDFPGGYDECKRLAQFIREKAGSVADRGALLQARKNYIKELETAKNDADAEVAKYSEDEMQKLEKEVDVAKKKTKKAKNKRNGNRFLNLAVLGIVALLALTGSLAFLSPFLGVVSALLVGLSPAAVGVLGFGLLYHWPNKEKRQEWWNKKGRNKFSGKTQAEELKKAIENEKNAQKTLDSKKAAKLGAETDAIAKTNEFESEAQIVDNNQFNSEARQAIDEMEERWRDLLTQCEASPTKHDWAVTHGRNWFKFAVSSVERDYARGKINDSNYATELSAIDSDFGIGGMFDPSVSMVDDYKKDTRKNLHSSIATEAEETEEAFWA